MVADLEIRGDNRKINNIELNVRSQLSAVLTQCFTLDDRRACFLLFNDSVKLSKKCLENKIL